jgi:hypothetical protein
MMQIEHKIFIPNKIKTGYNLQRSLYNVSSYTIFLGLFESGMLFCCSVLLPFILMYYKVSKILN